MNYSFSDLHSCHVISHECREHPLWRHSCVKLIYIRVFLLSMTKLVSCVIQHNVKVWHQLVILRVGRSWKLPALQKLSRQSVCPQLESQCVHENNQLEPSYLSSLIYFRFTCLCCPISHLIDTAVSSEKPVWGHGFRKWTAPLAYPIWIE